MRIFLLLYIMTLIHASPCISPIEYMEPPICTSKTILPIGLKNTYKYATLLFNTTDYILNEEQRNCILHSDNAISKNINTCTKQLTIHPTSIPIQVSRGLALNNESKWVSACAENMPCIEFNRFVYNHSFTSLINACNASEIYNWLLVKTPFIQSSWYGVEYCQRIDPITCMYQELEPCDSNIFTYPCPISRWVYASNFMLLYVLSPEIAARMPGCRIPYNISFPL